MNTSQEIDKIVEALASAHSSFRPLIRNKKANYGKYADLSAVMESISFALQSNGLCISQSPEFKDGRLLVTTRLLHKSGQWIENQVSLKPSQDTAQGIGGGITYGRRYGLTALLGICADDDDDGQSVQPQQKTEYEPKSQPTRQEEPTPQQLPPPRNIDKEFFDRENAEHRVFLNKIMTAAGMADDQKKELALQFKGKTIKECVTVIDHYYGKDDMRDFN